MRFRNYINTNNRRNRIFSEDDIWNMKLSNLFANEADIMAQNSAIGIPTIQELEQSPNTRMVDYSEYGDNAEDVARWESALDEIANIWEDKTIESIMPKDKHWKKRRDSEEDDNDDSGENPPQESVPSEKTPSEESQEGVPVEPSGAQKRKQNRKSR